MTEWPEERRLRAATPARGWRRFADLATEFLDHTQTARDFEPLVASLIHGAGDATSAPEKLAEASAHIAGSSCYEGYDEFERGAALALACVAAIRRASTRGMWEYLWGLARHSASLELLLPEAVAAAAEADTSFRKGFLTLSRRVVQAAAEHPGRRAWRGEEALASEQVERWRSDGRLSTLWRGQVGRSWHALGHDDDRVLAILAEFDVGAFVDLLDVFDLPDPVMHALSMPSRSFERWQRFVRAAPAAFDDGGGWNGSMILPLLLSLASHHIGPGIGRAQDPGQIARASEEVRQLASEVARTLSERVDFLGCAVRWSNWLLRGVIGSGAVDSAPYPVDASSRGFPEDAIVTALIAAWPDQAAWPEFAPDAEDWEPWCHMGVRMLAALSGKSHRPKMPTFLSDWEVGPDDYPGEAGERLGRRSTPFTLGTIKPDAYGARILSLILLEAEPAHESWRQLWEASATLREVVEFGPSESGSDGGWQERSNAARLVQFQFSLGLMMLDHLIKPQRPLPYDRSSAAKALLPSLDAAVREMAAIDRLNEKFWSEAVRHLAIRRVRYLSGDRDATDLVIDDETTPTFADFIGELSGDTENLLGLALVASRNDVDDGTIRRGFRDAGIDLQFEVSLARRLLGLSRRSLDMSEAQLQAVEDLSGSA